LLNDTLCEDIAELKPPLFALVRGCHAVRAKYRFLNISDLVEEIERAQRKARYFSHALEQFCLADFEADLRVQIENDALVALHYAAERKRRKRAEREQRKTDREREKWRRQWLADKKSGSDDGDST
jgi:hypothetical protein